MTRPSALWLTAAAVLVGYTIGWLTSNWLPQCMDRIVSGTTTRVPWWD